MTARNDTHAPAAPPAEKPSAQRMTTISRLGSAALRFDELIAERLPDAIGRGCHKAACSLGRGLHGGLWHNYAFYVVMAALVLTGVLLGVRGCQPGGGL